MSSSVDFPDWSAFSERETAGDAEVLSPASEIAALLQRYHSDLSGVRLEVEEARQAGLKFLAQQAVFVFQLETALGRYEADLGRCSLGRVHRHFRVLKDQMLDALKGAGLEIGIPLGQSFQEVADLVHVEGWRHHEQFSSEVVAEVVEPVITSGGRLVRLGRVVMGAPADQAVTESEPSTSSNRSED
jgi:hypothetical protein